MTKVHDQTQDTPQLSGPAQRALKEVQERKAAEKQALNVAPKEINGRGGLDPARFGDWEVKGLAVDF